MVGAARIFADEGESPARPLRAPDANGSLAARTGCGSARSSTCAARLRANGAHMRLWSAVPPPDIVRAARGIAHGLTALTGANVGRLPCPAFARARCERVARCADGVWLSTLKHAARPAPLAYGRTALADKDVGAAPRPSCSPWLDRQCTFSGERRSYARTCMRAEACSTLTAQT